VLIADGGCFFGEVGVIVGNAESAFFADLIEGLAERSIFKMDGDIKVFGLFFTGVFGREFAWIYE
jgi:hypothetical protein